MDPNFSKEFLMLVFVFNIIWGVACMYFAKKRGRTDPTSWFLLGFLFAIFAFAVLMLLPSKPQEMQLAAETKAVTAQTKEAQTQRLEPPVLTTTLEKRDWFYLDQNHKQQGPIDLNTLKLNRSSGLITDKTLMWSEGMLDWKQLEDLSYLQTELE